MNSGTFQLPPGLSTFSAHTDWVWYFIFWLSVVLFVAVIGTAMYFVWAYRARPGHKSEPAGHNTLLEVGWTASPVVILALLFHWGFQGWVASTTIPANAIEIRVRAKKWMWDFEYPNGAHEAGALVVPVGRPVKLVLSSDDVIHSFFVPAFRVKRDAVPGQFQTLWFQATQTTQGLSYVDLEGHTQNNAVPVMCTEYCGTGHSAMLARIQVVSDAEYRAHMDSLGGPPKVTDPATHQEREATPAEWGEMIYRSSACVTCHSLDGSRLVGPSWKGLFGSSRTWADGTSGPADENYIRQSILQPAAKVVQGFPPVMPPYAGTLNDRQIDAIIAFMKSDRLH